MSRRDQHADALSFETDVELLIRARDRRSMGVAFDLFFVETFCRQG